jgi:hypothetical protein
MEDTTLSESPILQDEKTPEESSQERAKVLEALVDISKKPQKPPKKKKPSSLSEQEQNAVEMSIVEEMNQTFAIVHTSSTYILIEKSETEFVLDSKSSFLNLFENQFVPELSGEGTKRPLTKAQVWLKSSHRRTFSAIVFNPKIPGHYDQNFNIWKGFAVKSKKGNCSLFWNHVETNICSGEKAHSNYVKKWLAHLIQKPSIIGTALVLKGRQGTGKGVFVEAIGKLFGPHYAHLSNLDRILGRFNSHLKNAILIHADEALWSGNRKEIGNLKALITESRLFIEGKGKDGYWIENFKHLIVSSNEDCPVPLDPDDRRFFVLNVSDGRKEDHAYFDALCKQLVNGGYEALMHDLLHEDLSEFDPRIMPENFAGFDMKLESGSSVERFIYVSLKEGYWGHAKTTSPENFQSILIRKFYGYYEAWCEQEKEIPLRKTEVGKKLRALLPNCEVKKEPRSGNLPRHTLYFFPPLEEFRASFEKFYKQDSSIWESP